MIKRNPFLFVLSLAFLSSTSFAFENAASLPKCFDANQNEILGEMNARVIQMQTTTPNQFLARARIKGKVGKVYASTPGHARFQAILGPHPGDAIEIVYNTGFGSLPVLRAGMDIDACGDYITSIAPAGTYQPSPDRAILHYVHKSTSRNHLSGYVVLDSVVYGQRFGLESAEAFLETSLFAQ